MKKYLFVMGLCLASASLVQAGYTLVYTNATIMHNDTNATINLPKFVAPWEGAVLTGVHIEFWTTISDANVQVDNDSQQSQTATARVNNQVNTFSVNTRLTGLDSEAVLSGFDLQLNVSEIFELGPTSGDTVGEFNATHDVDYANWSPGALEARGGGDLHSDVFEDYIGSEPDETFSAMINATYTTSATFSGELGYFQGNTPNGLFSGSVTYSFIPEPSTAMLIVLIAGAAGIRRRRRIVAGADGE